VLQPNETANVSFKKLLSLRRTLLDSLAFNSGVQRRPSSRPGLSQHHGAREPGAPGVGHGRAPRGAPSQLKALDALAELSPAVPAALPSRPSPALRGEIFEAEAGWVQPRVVQRARGRSRGQRSRWRNGSWRGQRAGGCERFETPDGCFGVTRFGKMKCEK